MNDFASKCLRHPFVWLAGTILTVAVFCAFPLAVVADSHQGIIRSGEELSAQFAWWPWALFALVVTVVWLNICEDREIIAVVSLVPRVVVMVAAWMVATAWSAAWSGDHRRTRRL